MRIIDSITDTTLESLATKRWEDQLLALTSYKQRYGTCDVPLNHPTLGTWAAEQRNQYRAYEQQLPTPLTAERYEKLKNIGITINRWEKRLVELKAYRAEHGHCDVPIDHPSGLGIWVSTQREHAHWNRDEMPKERIESLDAVGFNWNRWGHSRTKNRQDAWETQFIKLNEFIQEQGHSNISQHDKQNGKLGKWVKNQRYEYRKFMNKGLGPSRLGRDRIEKLESIGFQWRLRPEIIPWETRFEVRVFALYLSSCVFSFTSFAILVTHISPLIYRLYSSMFFSMSKNTRVNTVIVVYPWTTQSLANGPSINVINSLHSKKGDRARSQRRNTTYCNQLVSRSQLTKMSIIL